jgi:exodeoxyribonuclease VII small subunit
MPANKSSGAAAAKPHKGTEEAPSFEQALERLATIVDELEAGSLSLEESLARYEEGVRLSRRLTQSLDQAEKRIERLVEEQGQPPSTRPLELEAERNDRSGESGEGQLPF